MLHMTETGIFHVNVTKLDLRDYKIGVKATHYFARLYIISSQTFFTQYLEDTSETEYHTVLAKYNH